MTAALPPDEVRARLASLRGADLPLTGGTTLAYVYDSGLAEVDRLGREALASYAGTNGLDPTAFPSLLAMENQLVGLACDLLDAPPEAVGTVTSGGTESVLLACQTARDARPDITRPRLVMPSTAHAAFHKAAHYFRLEPVVVPVGDDYRADPAAMAAAVDADPASTVLVVVSAPSYAHGVIDPVAEIAAAAASRGVRCHVDACIGGWVLPYAARLGRAVPPWTFAVEGVTSISVDTHKYAYAPKGSSLLLHRSARLRRPQLFACAAWPGYTMLNSTLQSTKSGGPLAGAWAVTQAIGDDGYLDLARRALGAVDTIVAATTDSPWITGLHLVARPDSTLVVLGTDERCDPFTVCDEVAARGWWVQPQLAHDGRPASIHLAVSAATAARVDELVSALREATSAAVASGPVTVDPGVAELIRALDPASLTDDDFDGLLAASGLVGETADGGLVLPDRMAGINAMLDLASPALREALLTAFLDRLSRPTRADGRAGRRPARRPPP